MENNDIQNNIVSFILGVLVVIMFWLTFKPQYIIIKNNPRQLTGEVNNESNVTTNK